MYFIIIIILIFFISIYMQYLDRKKINFVIKSSVYQNQPFCIKIIF